MLLPPPPRPRPTRIQDPNSQLRTLDQLARQPQQIAIDTEFRRLDTLTIQAACRVDDLMVVNVYRSKSIPRPTARFDKRRYLPANEYGKFFENILLRPVGVIRRSSSPGQMLMDLFGIREADRLSRQDGLQRLSDKFCGPANGEWDEAAGSWKVPAIKVELIGHFLPADFARMYGCEFYQQLLQPEPGIGRPVRILDRKVLSFSDSAGQYGTAPVVEYLIDAEDRMFEVRLTTRDLVYPCGSASLETHSQTFLGLSKCQAISNGQKKNMRRTFRKHTDDAYGYAITDAVNTLLVYEQMNAEHRLTFAAFGCPVDEIPEMRPTLGSRVADFMTLLTRRSAAANSENVASNAALQRLIRGGGIDGFGAGVSHFGSQIARPHGGLLFSRTPAQFWHETVGMLRDVDMAGCYNRITSQLNVYWGKPVVLEPGDARTSLADAVELAKRHSPADGWFIRVTGDVSEAPNTLIPSTRDAVTSENYRQKRRQAQGRANSAAGRAEGSKLFSQRVESGVVTEATWQVIQALPERMRLEYESLTADSIVFYPRTLIAEDGKQFDRLVSQLQGGDLPWHSRLDFDQLSLTEISKIDHEYVSLRFGIGEYATRIGQLRKEARDKFGKGSGQEANLKVMANTIYGNLASPHLPTQNIVAANQITAKGRAAAFAMVTALNGLQVITDGCSYRRDRIPACTFAECLSIMPDYPLRHADEASGIPFVNPESIPHDDVGFTAWYREHVRRFFGISGSELDAVIALHDLEHKSTGNTGSVAFDAMACNGAGDYLKCVRQPDGGFTVEDAALRGFGQASKETLKPWILDAYSTDEMSELPPIAEDTCLLKYGEAVKKVAKAHKRGIVEAFLPLGLPLERIRNFRIIKASSFVFQTPEQYRAFDKQAEKFKTVNQCGLELIALRRGYNGQKTGSIQSVAGRIYELIQAGEHDFTKKLNLTRLSDELKETAAQRRSKLKRRRDAAEAELLSTIDASQVNRSKIVTGIVMTK